MIRFGKTEIPFTDWPKERQQLFFKYVDEMKKLPGLATTYNISMDDKQDIALEALYKTAESWEENKGAAFPSLLRTIFFNLLFVFENSRYNRDFKMLSLDKNVLDADEKIALGDLIEDIKSVKLEDQVSYNLLKERLKKELKSYEYEALEMLESNKPISDIIDVLKSKYVLPDYDIYTVIRRIRNDIGKILNNMLNDNE